MANQTDIVVMDKEEKKTVVIDVDECVPQWVSLVPVVIRALDNILKNIKAGKTM